MDYESIYSERIRRIQDAFTSGRIDSNTVDALTNIASMERYLLEAKMHRDKGKKVLAQGLLMQAVSSYEFTRDILLGQVTEGERNPMSRMKIADLCTRALEGELYPTRAQSSLDEFNGFAVSDELRDILNFIKRFGI